MRSVAADLAALDAFPVSLWIDALSLDTAAADTDCADHADALLPFSAPVSPITMVGTAADTLETRSPSLSLLSPKTLDGDLFDAMLGLGYRDSVLGVGSSSDSGSSINGSSDNPWIMASLETEFHRHDRHSLEAHDHQDESADECGGDRDDDSGHTDKDDSDSDIVMESPPSSATAADDGDCSKLLCQALEHDSSWIMIEMSDVEVVVEPRQRTSASRSSAPNPAASTTTECSGGTPGIGDDVSMATPLASDTEETPTPRRTSQRVSAASQRKTTQRLTKSATKLKSSSSSSVKATATRVSTTRPSTRLSTAAAPSHLSSTSAPVGSSSAVPSSTTATATTSAATATATAGVMPATTSTKARRKSTTAAATATASTATTTTSTAKTTRPRGRAKASALDPVARVHQRKTKQRGYERNYRGRLRTQRCQDELTWLACEAELRKVLARKQALTLPPRENVTDDAHARLLRKYTQLMYEERALKEEIVHLRVVDKWLEALDIWGVETEASRTIRYEVNTLPQLQAHPTFTHFMW